MIDAITEALIELGASTDEVTIEVISKGSKGFIGCGVKEAKVRWQERLPSCGLIRYLHG